MKNEVYIVHIENTMTDIWQLRDVVRHEVIACQDTKEDLLRCLVQIVVKYHPPKNFRKQVKTLRSEGNPQMSKQEYIQREEEYNKFGKLYEEDIAKAVAEGMQQVKPDFVKVKEKMNRLSGCFALEEEVVKEKLSLPSAKKVSLKDKIGKIKMVSSIHINI